MDELDLTDVTLVGNDTGGAICQIVAADHPKRLARLILTNCDAYSNFLPLAFRPLQLLARIPGALCLVSRTLSTRPVRAALGLLASGTIPHATYRQWVAPSRDAAIRADVGAVLTGISSRETLRAIAVLRHFDPRSAADGLIWTHAAVSSQVRMLG